MHEAQSFARVVVPSPLKDPLIYSVPHSLGRQIAIGSRVLVPLQRRTVTGVVWEVLAENPIDQAKPIIAALDDKPILDEQLLKLCAWISQYYLAPLGEVVATMLPPNSRRESKRTAILRSDPVRLVDELSQKVVDELRRQKGKLTVKTLTRKFLGQNIERILSRLEAAGAVQIEDRLAQQRTKKNDPFSSTRVRFTAASTTFSLTGEQGTALNAIEERIAHGGFETFLVHGVTGSGKTEVYLRAMERVRGLGGRSLILIPE
ncbi:MAG TPA: hypothetical protein VLA17_01170, partial [Candidatus Limnocylindria bacterium]|nr:hypothetical protein [Candidatus Limnocylindria bacterium]